METTNHDYSRADGFTAIPYTLEVRGRDGEGVLEHRQDNTANALRTPGGGRGGMGVGAVAFNWQEGAGGTLGMSDARTEGEPPVRVHQTLAVAIGLDPTGSSIDHEREVAPTLRGSGVAGNAGHHSGVCLTLAPTLTAANDPSRSPQSSEVTKQVAAVQAAASVVRRLTPVECCRLQGFPDNWNEAGIDKDGKRITMADSPRYRQLGNAVTVNVANWLARNLAAVYHPPEGAQHGQP